jgi:hypothetical protein
MQDDASSLQADDAKDTTEDLDTTSSDSEKEEVEYRQYVGLLMQQNMTNLKNKRKKTSALPLENKKPKITFVVTKQPELEKKIVLMKKQKGDVWFKLEDALDVNLLTTYIEGKTNANEQLYVSQSAKINEKITKHVTTFKGIYLKPDSVLYKKENNQFFVGMECLTCKKMHPRTALFFTRDGKLEDFESAQPAHERLNNNVSHPCRPCKQPQTEMQFLKAWKTKYIISIPQMIDKMFEQKGVGRISGLPIDFAAGKICICAYVNYGGKNAFASHTDENTFYDIMAFNPQQGKYLENLEDIYDEMRLLVIDLNRPNVEIFKKMHLTPQQSGVTANSMTEQKLYNNQIDYCHLPRIIQLMVSNLIRHDFDAGRISANNLAKTSAKTRKKIQQKVLDYIISVNGKCQLIGYDLTVTNGPYRFSLDRIDNSKAHFLGKDCLDLSNIRVICRVLNTPVIQTVAQHWICINHRRSLPRDKNGKAIYD